MLTLTEKPGGKEKKPKNKPQGFHFISQNRKDVPYAEKEEKKKKVEVVSTRL